MLHFEAFLAQAYLNHLHRYAAGRGGPASLAERGGKGCRLQTASSVPIVVGDIQATWGIELVLNWRACLPTLLIGPLPSCGFPSRLGKCRTSSPLLQLLVV